MPALPSAPALEHPTAATHESTPTKESMAEQQQQPRLSARHSPLDALIDSHSSSQRAPVPYATSVSSASTAQASPSASRTHGSSPSLRSPQLEHERQQGYLPMSRRERAGAMDDQVRTDLLGSASSSCTKSADG